MVPATQFRPGLFSIPRLTGLFVSFLVTIASGTNSAYSAYAPQLGARLHVNNSQLNLIGLAANMGGYLSCPMWGKFVDSRGPRFPLASAFISLLAGYYGTRHVYDIGIPVSESTLSPLRFYFLVFCSFLTGLGGTAGSTAAINSTAKNFPDNTRGMATGLVVSGFGLSAFLFSAISYIAFPDNTSSFLLLLTIGSAFPMLVGLFFIRPVPLPSGGPENGDTWFETTEMVNISSSTSDHDGDSHTHLLPMDPVVETTPGNGMILPARSQEFAPPDTMQDLDGRHGLKEGAYISRVDSPNIYGWGLLVNGNFWLLSSIISLLSGTALMYGNNVGLMSQALFAKGNPSYDEVQASRWQATQVSSISITSFIGHLCIGFVSDFAKNNLRLPRSSCLVLISCCFIISQIIAANVDDISHLWIPGALLGLATGCIFSLFPTLCIEWFGLPHFSETAGYVLLPPVLIGYIFCAVFGRNLDAHEPPKTQLAPGESASTLYNPKQCLEGRECYVNALYLTIAACFLAGALSAWAGWRDHQKTLAESKIPRAIDLAWEDSEDYSLATSGADLESKGPNMRD